MKRKAALSIITAAFLIGVAACGNGNINSSGAAASNENSALQQSDAAENSTRKTSATEENADTEDASTENNADSNTDTEESAQNGTGTENTEGLTFADLAEYQFEFCSGAGGWATDFIIDSDGHFSGEYHDSDMGVTGDGYENGTVYISVFDGHFKDLTPVNDHCYRMTLADISYQENEFGREEIKDGTKYVYSDAYGLTGTDTFLVYMEGTPVSEISEEVYSWLSMANKSDTELTMVALVNEGQEEGIYSYKKLSPLEDAQTTFESYTSSYEYWTDEIDKAESQSEINDDSQKRYEVMDECLNYIWNLIKNDTDENAYQKILEEQRTWIADKEAKGKGCFG